jgi:hypothetical protein
VKWAKLRRAGHSLLFPLFAIVKICWCFLRIQIPRFNPEREVNKWLPIILTWDRINVLVVRGGNKRTWTWTWTCFLVENTWPYTGFQPMGALGVAEQHGFKAMFWAHWEPKGRYVWSVRETGCVSPLMQMLRVFCCSDCCVYIRGSGANFSEYCHYWFYWLKGQCKVKIVYICPF